MDVVRLVAAGLLTIMLAGCPHAASTPTAKPRRDTEPLSVEVIPRPVYASPMLTLTGEYAQLLFHLNIHNKGDSPVRIRQVELTLVREGEVLERQIFSELSLKQRLRSVPWIVMRDRQTIAAAHRYRGMLARPAENTVVPPRDAVSLIHQHSIVRPRQLPDRIRCTITHRAGRASSEVAVHCYQQRTPLRLPFAGRWWVMGGHRFDEHHASAVLDSQNFAYDLGILGGNGSTSGGDIKRNKSYHANGQPVLAAADGTVVAVHDGVPENVPVGRRPTWQGILRRPKDLAGNHVIVRHADSEYSAYLHLRPGIEVRQGDDVRAGQRLGRCGNSGNSRESHLHFQLQDGPDLFRAKGLPARFSDFTVHIGRLRMYIPTDRPMPLPSRLFVEPGHGAGAVEISKILLR
jgi:hypothetical protein